MKIYFTSLCILGLLFFTSCSNDDVPGPVDCNTSTLAISVLSKTNVSGCGVSDGTISVTVTGGSPPYTLNINGGANSSTTSFVGLAAGTHTITVKDEDGCERVIVVEVEDPTAGFTTSSVIVEDNECLTDNGSITINAAGGTEPFMYKFGTGTFGTTNTFTGLKNGTYTIEVKDATDCPKVINAVVPLGDTGVDYNNDILPILQAKCQFSGCHPDNGNWFDYTTAKSNAALIKTRTGNGSMPKAPQPGGALSANQIALIACWVDGGAKEN